jgi:hypothetical protein
VADPQDQRKTLGDAGKVDVVCSEIEAEIAALRAKYEQYFLGVERKPPSAEHTALKKKVSGLRNTFVRQVATKFRVEAVTSKLLTYERLWTRTLQEIEAGTYRRDLFKLKLRSKDREEQLNAEQKAKLEKAKAEKAAAEKAAAEKKPGAPVPAVAAAGAAPQRPPAVAAAPKVGPQGPAQAVAGQLSDQKMKAIFDAYVMAKRRCNEDVSKLSLDGLSQTLRKQVPELMKAHNAKSVEFKVVIKDGKAILRALPKDT